MKKINNVMVMAAVKGQALCAQIKDKLKDNNGQFAADHSLAIAITVAIAGISLLLASNLLKDTIAPTLTSKIAEFFNYK